MTVLIMVPAPASSQFFQKFESLKKTPNERQANLGVFQTTLKGAKNRRFRAENGGFCGASDLTRTGDLLITRNESPFVAFYIVRIMSKKQRKSEIFPVFTCGIVGIFRYRSYAIFKCLSESRLSLAFV